MTTIAYKDGIIAVDSRVCSGCTIVSDDADKIRHLDGKVFILGGDHHLQEELIADYPNGRVTGGNATGGFVFDGGILYTVGVLESGKIFRELHDLDAPWASGSGGDHALTAMDMGASAEEAVAMAAKRDIHTGGKVKTFELPVT